MATPELGEVRKKAGEEYLAALMGLGLNPDALFWAFDQKTDGFVLMLATEMFDFKGPLELSKTLFKAYNASATPKEIDPFIVRVHSPEHSIIRHFDGWKGAVRLSDKDGKPIEPPVVVQAVTFGDMTFSKDWVYRYTLPRRRSPVDLSRKWRRFVGNVDRLAA